MKKIFTCLSLLLLILIWNPPSKCQIVTRTIDGDGDMFRIPELSVVLSEADEKTVKVEMAMPSDMRREPYRNVDIKEGDIILYLNGKRIKKVKDFEEKYGTLEIGEKVQIGIKREDNRFIISFEKADPKDLPQMNVVTERSGEGGEHQGGGRRTMRISSADFEGYENVTPFLGLGIIVGLEDEKVKVARMLPIPNIEKNDLKAGDVIQAVNGQAIESVQQFEEIFEDLAVGDNIELEFLRDGKTMSTSIKKPEARGTMRIRRNQQ